jgi:hypothetical protein
VNSFRVTLRLTVYLQSVRLGTKPLETHGHQFFFQLNSYGHSLYVTSSLTRGWICSLQLLLGLASALILRSGSRGTHNHILLSQIWDSPSLEGQVPYLYPPGTGWPGYTPRHLVPFLSPPTTRRATVEAFEPASTRATKFTELISPTVVVLTYGHGSHGKHRSSIVTIVAVAEGTCLLSCCLETGCVTPFI